MSRDGKLNFVIQAKDQASPAINAVKQGLSGLRSAADATGKATSDLWNKYGDIATAAGAVAFLKSSVQASAEAERIQSQLVVSLGRVGVAYTSVQDQIEAFAAAQQKATQYDGEMVSQSLTALVNVTGEFNDSTLKAAKAAEDLATATGMDLVSASRAVAQALEGNVKGLGQYVPALKDMGQEALAALSPQERMAVVLAELDKAYGGSSESLGKQTLALARLANAYGDLQEAVGGLVGSAGGMAVLEGYISSIGDLAGALDLDLGSLVATALKLNAATGAFAMIGDAFGLDISGRINDANDALTEWGKSTFSYASNAEKAAGATDDLNAAAGRAPAALDPVAEAAKRLATSVWDAKRAAEEAATALESYRQAGVAAGGATSWQTREAAEQNKAIEQDRQRRQRARDEAARDAKSEHDRRLEAEEDHLLALAELRDRMDSDRLDAIARVEADERELSERARKAKEANESRIAREQERAARDAEKAHQKNAKSQEDAADTQVRALGDVAAAQGTMASAAMQAADLYGASEAQKNAISEASAALEAGLQAGLEGARAAQSYASYDYAAGVMHTVAAGLFTAIAHAHAGAAVSGGSAGGGSAPSAAPAGGSSYGSTSNNTAYPEDKARPIVVHVHGSLIDSSNLGATVDKATARADRAGMTRRSTR